MQKLSSAELVEQLKETKERLAYDNGQDDRARAAWKSHEQALAQQLWDLQHHRTEPN